MAEQLNLPDTELIAAIVELLSSPQTLRPMRAKGVRNIQPEDYAGEIWIALRCQWITRRRKARAEVKDLFQWITTNGRFHLLNAIRNERTWRCQSK